MLTPDQLTWENSTCDWCGSNETELVFEGPDRLEHLPGQFRMVRCTKCGLYRQNPRLDWESLKFYYPDNYVSHPNLAKHETSVLKRLDIRYGPWKRLRAIEQFQAGGRLLEIGCGTGLFLEEAIRSGRWEVEGIEPTQRAAKYVQENLKIPIHVARFSDVDLPKQSFDVIAMWNVLEHLDHPIADLHHAYTILKDYGWLVFSIPNLESLEARIFGPYWVGWDLPRHLYLFPQNNLHEILKTIGFQWKDSRCISTSYAVLGHSLDFWSQSWAKRYPRLRSLLLKAYKTTIARLLLVPPLYITDRLKVSTILTIFAQKIPPQS